MSPAGGGVPTPDARHASDRLVRQLDWSDTFWLAWLFTLSPPQAAFVIEQVSSATGRTRVLAPRTPQELEGLLPELLRPTLQCVIITAIHGKRSPDGEAWRDAWMQLVLRVNERREQLRTCLRGGLVLAAHGDVKSVVRDAAPDLWSVRTFAFDLPGPPGMNAPIPAIMLGIPTQIGETSAASLQGMLSAPASWMRRVQLARQLFDQGQYAMAQTLAYALSTEFPGRLQRGHALCVVVRAAVMANDLDAANDAARSLALLGEASMEALDWRGESLASRGMLLVAVGRLDDALELTIRAMTSLRQRDALARARRQAGLCQASLGRWTEAIATLELAMRDFAELEPQSPDLAKTMHCLAATHHALGDLESAQRLLAEAIAITEPLAERHPSQFCAHLDMMRGELRALGDGSD